MTERILYDAGGHFDHRGTYHPHRPPATTTEQVDSDTDWRDALPPAPGAPTVTITTAPEPDWKGRTAKAEETADDLHVLALDWKAQAEKAEAEVKRMEQHAVYWMRRNDHWYDRFKEAKAQRNSAACHAVRLDDKVKQMGGQILALECELCEKVEHIKGLDREAEREGFWAGLGQEFSRQGYILPWETSGDEIR